MNRRITADEAHALLKGTTAGPWQYDYPYLLQLDDEDADAVAEVAGVSDADGRLMAAAPDLAASVIAAEEELSSLRRLVAKVREDRLAAEQRAITAERALEEMRDIAESAVAATRAKAWKHRQDLVAIANALGCVDSAVASLVSAGSAIRGGAR